MTSISIYYEREMPFCRGLITPLLQNPKNIDYKLKFLFGKRALTYCYRHSLPPLRADRAELKLRAASQAHPDPQPSFSPAFLSTLFTRKIFQIT